MTVRRIGIGLRRELATELLDGGELRPDLLEIAPENWMDIGGHWESILERCSAQYPLIAHGLSLSLGSPDEIDWAFVRRLKRFFERYSITLFSEHLSFCSCENAHLYDLLPLPFRRDAAIHVADRISKVQNELGMRIYVENISYYAAPGAELTEAEFLLEVLERSGCGLLLDINNVYVNAHNHNYDAHTFLNALSLERVGAVHVAGHENRSDGSILDTHGDPVRREVWELLQFVIDRLPPSAPLILERDFNLTEVVQIGEEVAALRAYADRAGGHFSC